MARKKLEKNISYDNVRKVYYVNMEYGTDSTTGKRVKKTKTFDSRKDAQTALKNSKSTRSTTIL